MVQLTVVTEIASAAQIKNFAGGTFMASSCRAPIGIALYRDGLCPGPKAEGR
jgi:hypothetical protein